MISHMCRFGMQVRDSVGLAPVKKPTRFMSNSSLILQELDKQCLGCPRHADLQGGGRAAQAAIYPKGLCQAVCRGVRRQLKVDEADMVTISVVSGQHGLDNVDIHDLWASARADGKQYRDDVSGQVLDPTLTQQARIEEIKEAERMGVWVKVGRDECLRVTGRGPIGTRLVDTNKGGSHKPTSAFETSGARVEAWRL